MLSSRATNRSTLVTCTSRSLATPGHTPGSICYLMDTAGPARIFTGDVISSLVGDETSLIRARWPLGTYSAYLPRRYRGDAHAYLASLHKLRSMKVPDLVFPGHPRSDPSPQEPCLTQDRWNMLLDKGVRDMEVVLSRYAADGASFLDGEPKRLMADLYYLGDLSGVSVYGFLASSRFFLVNAPAGPDLAGFVDSRLRRIGVEPTRPFAVLLTSCEPKKWPGSRSLFDASHPRLVAGPGSEQASTEICGAGAVVVDGRYPAPSQPLVRGDTDAAARRAAPAAVAYQVRLAGKTVLFGGAVPIQTEGRDCAPNVLTDHEIENRHARLPDRRLSPR